jgi:hypothetical protein
MSSSTTTFTKRIAKWVDDAQFARCVYRCIVSYLRLRMYPVCRTCTLFFSVRRLRPLFLYFITLSANRILIIVLAYGFQRFMSLQNAPWRFRSYYKYLNYRLIFYCENYIIYTRSWNVKKN